MKNPNESVHAYLYDKFGRLEHDRVTAFGSGIDQAVKRLTRAYDARGLLERVGSYDSATVGSGSLENEVVFEYDDFGNLAKDRQSHAGAVGGSTPAVAYAHEDGFYNNTRLTAMTYPNGRVVQMGYGTTGGRDDLLSRISSVKIQGESHDAVTYRYAGLARYIAIRYPQPGVELDYVKATGDPLGDGGDPYTGYDRFGRTVDMRWKSTADGSMRDRIQYGYDRANNRKWRQDLVATNGQDHFYAYDGLYQVAAADRGYLNINRTAIGAIPATTEAFAYDPTGNWTGYLKTVDGTTTLDQSRTNNVDNQVTQIDGSSALLAYDLAGNAMKVPPGTGGDWSNCFQPVWDAWNRIVEVKDELGATVQKYAYDGMTRRITTEAGGTVTHTYWSRRWKPLEERIGSATTAARQYLWGERPGHRDELVLRDRDTDGNGTLDERLYATMDYFNGTAVLNPSGAVLERYAYSAFGVRRVMAPDYTPRTSSSYAWDFGFQGQFRDAPTGWSNYGYRFYVPELGRWINRDPIGERGGKNLYKFVSNSVPNRNDWYGLDENESTCGAIRDSINKVKGDIAEKKAHLATFNNAMMMYMKGASEFVDSEVGEEYLTAKSRDEFVQGTGETGAIATMAGVTLAMSGLSGPAAAMGALGTSSGTASYAASKTGPTADSVHLNNREAVDGYLEDTNAAEMMSMVSESMRRATEAAITALEGSIDAYCDAWARCCKGPCPR